MMTLNYNEKDFQKKLQKDIEMPEIVHEHINQAYRLIENNAVLQKKASKDPYHWMKSGGRIAGGMAAERLRLDVISQNVANAKTTRTEDGTPYRRQVVLFSENKGFNSVLEETIAKRKEKIAGGVPANTVSATKNKGVLVTEIVEDETPLTPVYDPTHPDADENGYYYLPNVDVAEEEMDAMAATRSYEANLAVLNAVKSMAQTALSIGNN